MAQPDRKLFRAEAMKHLASPDNLEQLMPVAGAKDWLLMATVLVLLVLFGIWSVAGEVPTIVTGRGVILRPRHLMQAQASAPGRILTLQVHPGDHIAEGDLIATLDQSDIVKRVAENRRAIDALEDQDRRKTGAENSQVSQQAQQDVMERRGLEAQRTALRKSLADATGLKPILEGRVDTNRKMVEAGLLGFASKDIADAESAAHDNEARIDDYNSRLAQIDGQLQQIETRAATLSRQFLADGSARRNEIEELRKSVELDSFQIVREGSVRSQYSGRVSEVMAAAGEVVPAGGKLLTLEADDSSAAEGLISISYYPVKDGKQ